MRLKQSTVHLLRHAGVLGAADALRGRWLALRGRTGRKRFQASGEPLPPNHLAYDAYGSLDWDGYWRFGISAADFLADLLRTHASHGRVLEWGCGPARIIRHLPARLRDWDIHGIDVNPETARWCAAHIKGVSFRQSNFAPPLPYPAAHFDCVYAVSVFTHLSAEMNRLWAAELRRVLRPGGLFVCTLHGDATRAGLMAKERASYDAGALVVRDRVAEGTRCFTAYHPPAFVRRELLKSLSVVAHHPGGTHPLGIQDLWIAVT